MLILRRLHRTAMGGVNIARMNPVMAPDFRCEYFVYYGLWGGATSMITSEIVHLGV